MIREPVFASILHIYCTRITAVQPPEIEDRETAVIGWIRSREPLLYRSTQTGMDFQKSPKKTLVLDGCLHADQSLTCTSNVGFAARLERPTDLRLEVNCQYRTFLGSAANDGTEPIGEVPNFMLRALATRKCRKCAIHGAAARRRNQSLMRCTVNVWGSTTELQDEAAVL